MVRDIVEWSIALCIHTVSAVSVMTSESRGLIHHRIVRISCNLLTVLVPSATDGCC